MSSRVTAIAVAEPDLAASHFESHLTFETDCWDVHASMADSCKDFVLLDVRSAEAFARGHIVGAISLPHAAIDEAALTSYPKNTLFVVYCAGPHCNGAHRAAIRLGKLGRKVKVMIGGITGWLDEGFTLERAGARDAADSAGA